MKSDKSFLTVTMTMLTLSATFVFSGGHGAAEAQSLKTQTPYPMQVGINSSTVINFVGTHYWYFEGGPGKVHLHCQLKPMALFGNPQNNSVTFTLQDDKKTWKPMSKVLTSSQKPVDCDFDGDLKSKTKLIVTVAPPNGGLIRMGGDYEIESSGAVSFEPKPTGPQAVGMYKPMSGFTQDLGQVKLNADGSVQTTTGAGGKWQLFDIDSQTYTIDIEGQQRKTLQFHPGLGLMDNTDIVLQSLR
jgi:hypothetical protein